MKNDEGTADEAPATAPARNGAQDNASVAVDQWFGNLSISLGPMLTTDVYNRIAHEKDTLKAALDAALA